jgi:di/tricarboxylate transporter
MLPILRISAGFPRDEGRMLNRLTRALVKVVVASIIVGTILAHFGITTDQLMKTAGFSSDRLTDFARAGFAWALPNLMLGAVVIVPLWFLIYLFRPPGESRD